MNVPAECPFGDTGNEKTSFIPSMPLGLKTFHRMRLPYQLLWLRAPGFGVRGSGLGVLGFRGFGGVWGLGV